METRRRSARLGQGPAVAVANAAAFGAGASNELIPEDDGESDADASPDDDTSADADELRNPAAAAAKDTPLGAFLRAHMTANNSNIDEAVEAWRLSKPSSRTYKNSFRCIVRFWCKRGNVDWNTAWNNDAALTWNELCTTVKELIDKIVRFDA